MRAFARSTVALSTVCAGALAASVLATPAAHAACTYKVDKNAVKVEWTAFKLTEKVGVTGTFKTTQLTGKSNEASSLTDLAKGLTMKIDGASIESGNPGRNATISEFFFQQFKPSGEITGQAKSVEGNDESGTVQIAITMNGTTKTVPFKYTITPKNEVEATATIDMMDFALQGPFDTLHQACEEKHTGEDGVSKTWTDVDLKLTGKFSKSCS